MVKKFVEYMEEVKKLLNYRGIEPDVKKKQDLMSLIDEVRQLKTVIQKRARKLKSLRQDWMNWNNILGWMTWLYLDL